MIAGFRTRLISCLAALLLGSFNINAQYYNTGQDPASLKWMQVNTGRFRVIYPLDYGQEGMNFASLLEEAYSGLSFLYPDKEFRIPVIIHNHTTRSNGYVAWAPKRMEIYPTPDQNTIPLDHKRQLAIHEMVHVMQMESLNSGFSRVMSYAAGQQFPGAMAALLPLWFMEGEAVLAETMLTGSGRGRSPSFMNSLKAIAIESRELLKYDKLLNGSYRNYTPDYYQYGYQMVAWSALNSPPDMWNKVLSYTANMPFTFNPVNISLRKNAGLTKKMIYYQTFDTLTRLWEEDIEMSGAINYKALNPARKTEYESYHSPVYSGNDSIIAVKTSLHSPSSFVLIRPSEKTEKKIFVPGNLYPWFISCSKGKIVWVENRPDPRWDNRDYSVIMIFDMKSSRPRQLSFRSRYMSASVSPDGNLIAASENSIDNSNNLVLINSNDGSIIKSVPAPGNSYLQRPQWSSTGKELTVISLTERGEGIMCYSLSDDNWTTLMEEGCNDLQSSFLRGDSLFFVSSESGTDNIYMLTPEDEKLMLTNSKFGVSDPSTDGDNILFSNYRAAGNDICSVAVSQAFKPEAGVTAKTSYFIDRLEKRETEKMDPDIQLTAVPYRKWKHLFSIHSWMPFYADIEQVQSDPASIRPGFSLLSQNHLSTVTATAGYEYSADRRHKLHSRIIWEGWYPVIDTRIDYGNEPVIDLYGETPSGIPSPLRQGLRLYNNIYIPWNFTTGKFYQYVYPFVTVDYRNDYLYDRESGNFDFGQTKLSGRLYLANYHRASFRDIYPRFGQVVDVAYESAPFDDRFYGSDITLKSLFYFPGLFRNHGIRIRYETEDQKFVKYLTSNKISYPRGYKDIISEKLDFFSVDYAAPLFYPDFNISSLLYLKRIRAGIFFDLARGTDNYYLRWEDGSRVVDLFTSGKESFSSFGIELLADFHVLRIPYPVSAGVQAAWESISQTPSLELIFNIDIYGMNIGRMLR